MRKLFVTILLVGCWQAVQADIEQVFTIEQVGVRNNSGTVFINTLEHAAASQCGHMDEFKIPLDDPIADKLLAIALTAFSSDRKIEIFCIADVCVGSGIRPNVIIIK